MSNRSFISRAAEERRQRLVVGRVVAQNFAACLAGRFERIEHRVDSLIRIGDLALPLHRIEIIHIGQIGLFIAAEQTHRISRLEDSFLFDAFSSREPVATSLENAPSLFDAFSSREPAATSLETATLLFDAFSSREPAATSLENSTLLFDALSSRDPAPTSLENAMIYSTTFGTRKKWSSVAGAFLTTLSAISPSLTTSGRFFISIGITEVIGSTPSTFTSDSCSTKASMAFNSPCRCGTSVSVTAIRARCAIRRTVAASTDIII